jgi:hypothetical protein
MYLSLFMNKGNSNNLLSKGPAKEPGARGLIKSNVAPALLTGGCVQVFSTVLSEGIFHALGKRKGTGAVQDAVARFGNSIIRASVLECGGPPPLVQERGCVGDQLQQLHKK